MSGEQDVRTGQSGAMKALAYGGCIVGGAVLCYLLVSLGVVDAVAGLPGTMQEPAIAMPTYLSFISAMMTAVTAVLAAVAIGIGIVAAFTFREITEKAERAATAKVEDLVAEKLSDKAIKARVAEIAFATGPETEWDDDENNRDDSDER